MSTRIPPSGDLAREALSAARAQLERAARGMGAAQSAPLDAGASFESRVRDLLGQEPSETRGQRGAAEVRGAQAPDFGNVLSEGIDALHASESSRENALKDVLTGELTSLPELAARVRRADLTLKYSMEIRNRLIDAYREVMRMSV
jgi:flagellar hook-basal body complex protein FliE